MAECSNCRFWVKLLKSRMGEIIGECRINPPSVYPGPDFQDHRMTLWPRTESHDWCGRHLTGKETAPDSPD